MRRCRPTRRSSDQRYGDSSPSTTSLRRSRPGTITGFLGPTAAGKTTTLRLAARLPAIGRALQLYLRATAIASSSGRPTCLSRCSVRDFSIPDARERNHLRVLSMACEDRTRARGQVLECRSDRGRGSRGAAHVVALGMAPAARRPRAARPPFCLILDEPRHRPGPLRGMHLAARVCAPVSAGFGRHGLISSHIRRRVRADRRLRDDRPARPGLVATQRDQPAGTSTPAALRRRSTCSSPHTAQLRLNLLSRRTPEPRCCCGPGSRLVLNRSFALHVASFVGVDSLARESNQCGSSGSGRPSACSSRAGRLPLGDRRVPPNRHHPAHAACHAAAPTVVVANRGEAMLIGSAAGPARETTERGAESPGLALRFYRDPARCRATTRAACRGRALVARLRTRGVGFGASFFASGLCGVAALLRLAAAARSRFLLGERTPG